MATGIKFRWVRGNTYNYTVRVMRGGAPLDITGYRVQYKAGAAITKDTVGATITIPPGIDGLCTFTVTSAETAALAANPSPTIFHEMACRSPAGVVKRVFQGEVSVDESVIGAIP